MEKRPITKYSQGLVWVPRGSLGGPLREAPDLGLVLTMHAGLLQPGFFRSQGVLSWVNLICFYDPQIPGPRGPVQVQMEVVTLSQKAPPP